MPVVDVKLRLNPTVDGACQIGRVRRVHRRRGRRIGDSLVLCDVAVVSFALVRMLRVSGLSCLPHLTADQYDTVSFTISSSNGRLRSVQDTVQAGGLRWAGRRPGRQNTREAQPPAVMGTAHDPSPVLERAPAVVPGDDFPRGGQYLSTQGPAAASRGGREPYVGAMLEFAVVSSSAVCFGDTVARSIGAARPGRETRQGAFKADRPARAIGDMARASMPNDASSVAGFVQQVRGECAKRLQQ